jgi:hypothetical protein
MAPPGRDDTLTLVVLGDSTAAGLGDPVGPGLFRGFGPLLAGALGAPDRVRLVNTGCSGARVACVRRDQLPPAVAARPHVAVLLVGINDTLYADFDPVTVRDDLARSSRASPTPRALVLGVRYHHHGRVFPLPGPLARALDARIDLLNASSTGSWRARRRVPGSRGAPGVLPAGRLEHRPAAPVPARPPGARSRLRRAGRGRRARRRPRRARRGDDRVPTRAEELHWLVTQGVPWLGRRSRDLLPLLLTARAAGAVRPPGSLPPGAERPVGRAGSRSCPRPPAGGWRRPGRRCSSRTRRRGAGGGTGSGGTAVRRAGPPPRPGSPGRRPPRARPPAPAGGHVPGVPVGEGGDDLPLGGVVERGHRQRRGRAAPGVLQAVGEHPGVVAQVLAEVVTRRRRLPGPGSATVENASRRISSRVVQCGTWCSRDTPDGR